MSLKRCDVVKEESMARMISRGCDWLSFAMVASLLRVPKRAKVQT